ncbi:hypothetical protein GCM10023405_38390 [Streptomonospora salina]
MSAEGAETILRMSVSRKRGGQIGRFGVGVKSVLTVSDTPQFFSRIDGVEFGFGFDREWSAAEIRTVSPGAEETPVLRMATPLDPAQERRDDPVLDELAAWATTVVRIPLKPGSHKRLGKDLADFPVEFPLFSPHVGAVVLDDRRGARPVRRRIHQRVFGDFHTLTEDRPGGDSVQHEWRVFTRKHAPSDKALRSAGELHDRPEVDVSWAVPAGRRERGDFWAYFPTKFKTTLRGILNAPWKTSEDRQAIFDGNAFNDELLDVAASLVVDSLPLIAGPDDPARFLDYLPGRGREAPQFADGGLTEAIWRIAAERPSLPNQKGAFRSPDELSMHPAGLDDTCLKMWQGYEGRPVDWVHHSTERRERRARVGYIFDRAGKTDTSVEHWLNALVADRTPTASATAVRILGEIVRRFPDLREDALKAKVVLTESGELVRAERGHVFRRSSDDDLQDDLAYVDGRVLDHMGVTTALDDLGVREADATGRFAAVVDRGFGGYSDDAWTAFWELSRRVTGDRVLSALREGPDGSVEELRVRTVDGEFRPLRECLAPGPVVPDDGSRDADIAVDMRFHGPDRTLLTRLGLIDRPAPEHDPTEAPWFEEYAERARETYVKQLDPKASRPRAMHVEGPSPAGPLDLLTRLSPEGCAAYVRHLPVNGLVSHWTVQGGRQSSTPVSIRPPLVWMVRRHAVLPTSAGLARPSRCVGPALSDYRDVFPVADISPIIADHLGLPATLEKVPAPVWKEACTKAAASEDDRFPGRVYSLLLQADTEWPEGVGTRCRVGDTRSCEFPDSEIAVTHVRSEYDSLVREGLPALWAPDGETAAWLRQDWGMLDPADVIQKEVRFEADSEPVLLRDEFPNLHTHARAVENRYLVRCNLLEEVVRTPQGARTIPLERALHENTVLVLAPGNDLETLVAVDAVLRLGLGRPRCERILQMREKQREDELVKRIRAATTDEEKFLVAIGEERLRAGLPEGLVEAESSRTGKTPEGPELARLALHAYGDGVLREYNKDVAARIKEAPSTFSGSATSRRFVSELGLPESYAGHKAETPPETEKVDGPTDFPQLHGYQEKLVANMLMFLKRQEPGRAMLRLPTGAGKTRVAVEAVIRMVRERGIDAPILWIAQTEELCEQAVQSWKFVWSAVGPRQSLTVSRFWGGNDAAPVDGFPHLVVATDAKLDSRLSQDDYAWLREAALVIVDEGHAALSERPTAVLRQLGLDQNRNRTDRPLVGLTATPFRSDEEETRRLVNRFGGVRLDEGVFDDQDPLVALQEIGVLARVEHRELKGSTLTLDEEERKKADRWLPSSAEQRLGMFDERNRMLIDEIKVLPREWPVLLFATSVNHAKVIAAMLNAEKIPSASIDGFTPTAERRKSIEDYRSGKIRVLTNYGVLAQGFDAPATRAVVIARPTYSPAVYQQMIGRGLRGPANGGAETCRILDVHDNVENFNRSLAFTGFEHLWGMR